MKKQLLLGGHWTAIPEGWEDWPESKQDITKPFPLEDNSVDTEFLCHVIEHVSFTCAIDFLRESHRILKPGGIIRIVCPFVDIIAKEVTKQPSAVELYDNYFKNSLAPYYPSHIEALKELGLDSARHWEPFIIDSLIKNHGHQFVWSRALLVDVLMKVGFSSVATPPIGTSAFDSGACLERRIRGVDKELVDKHSYSVWDIEGGVVEAKK